MGLSLLLLWIFFVNVMTWKTHIDKIPKWLQYILYPIAIFGYLWDVMFNWVFGTVIFLELPRKPTLSERMRRILLTRDGWRWKLARYICLHLVEPWDQNHCGLESLEK